MVHAPTVAVPLSSTGPKLQLDVLHGVVWDGLGCYGCLDYRCYIILVTLLTWMENNIRQPSRATETLTIISRPPSWNAHSVRMAFPAPAAFRPSRISRQRWTVADLTRMSAYHCAMYRSHREKILKLALGKITCLLKGYLRRRRRRRPI